MERREEGANDPPLIPFTHRLVTLMSFPSVPARLVTGGGEGKRRRGGVTENGRHEFQLDPR